MKKIICTILGHDLVYFDEPVYLLIIEFGTCERCKEFCFVSDIREQ